jgi:hypothetical protein
LDIVPTTTAFSAWGIEFHNLEGEKSQRAIIGFCLDRRGKMLRWQLKNLMALKLSSTPDP